ncbi:MAG: PKD domain-containing protein [Pyrinomonadaceae bacterium]|nr:PKD domain-containing protein [Pyrinomonadaceae bacterium]
MADEICTKVRAYPRPVTPERLENVKIYGSNTSPTSGLTLLGTFPSTITNNAWNEVTFSNSTIYKYLIIRNEATWLDCAELEFYAGSSKITPLSYGGTPEYGYPDPTLQTSNAFDGSTSTYFGGNTPSNPYLYIEIAITDTTKPSDVTNLTATKVSNSRIDIDSDAATDNIAVAGYQTQVSSDGGTTWNTLSSTAKSFSFVSGNAYFPNVPGVYSLTFRRKAFDTASTPNYSNNWSNIPTAVSITVPVTPPVANFTIEPNTIVTGGTVVLTDTSTNSPTSKQWKLDGTNISTASPYSLNTTGLSLGTHTIRLEVSNAGGSDYKELTFTVVAAIVVPTSRWSKIDLIPRANLLKWGNLDNAVDGTEVGDYSGNDRKMVCASSLPVLQSNVINGKPALYFDGTKNPIKFTGSFTAKHIFLVAAFDGASFTGNEGLLSGVAATSILRGNGATTTKFANLSIGSGFSYRKSYVTLAESNELAPMAGSFSILELTFPTGISLDGFQIGQDTSNTGRKWKGWYVEDLVYGVVKNYAERMRIYRYFAMKFFLWRELADGTKIFPFPNNHQSPFSPSRYKIQSAPLPNGKTKTRVKGSKLQNFEFGYTTRRQEESDAIDKFETDFFDGRTIAVENNSFYPPRMYNVVPTSDISVEPQGINLFGYKWTGRQADANVTEIDVS